jgi:hypothetical protein
MQNILILADGISAEHFIERIEEKRIGKNRYTIVASRPLERSPRLSPNLVVKFFDPTSRMKLSKVLHAYDFSVTFIVLDDADEARASLDNIRAEDERMQIVLLDRWGAFSVLHERAVHVVDEAQLVASRLFDHLPNVPVIAQNVGLAQGEIMEVLVPYGSSFAYRHVGSITQVKWRIGAIYREGKQILPNHATMIRPQDTLLIIGKPQVLTNIYHRISKKEGRFPEPFGRNLYLIVDMGTDAEQALAQLKESIHLLDRLEEGKLFVRLFHPGDFDVLETIRGYDGDRIDIHVTYGEDAMAEVILDDVIRFDIGLLLMAPRLFADRAVADELLAQRKLVLLFGDAPLFSAERSVILMTDEAEMESISSTLFYASEALELKPYLCHYDPEGDFTTHKMIVEHYETLSKIFQYPITIEEKTINPIRALESMDHILQIVPFTRALQEEDLFKIFSTRLSDYLLDSARHPKLLVPAES